MTVVAVAVTPAAAPALDFLLAHFDGAVGSARRLRRPRALIYLCALLAIALGAWAALAMVDRMVRTQGRIVPSAKQQLVQHLEGGIVSKVYVREGDVVRAGDSLVAVSDLAANSSRDEKQMRLNGLQARIGRLTAEAQGASRLAAPSGTAAATPDARAEADAFSARQTRLRQTTLVLEQQMAQRRQEVAETEARRKGLSAELDVARQQLALVQTMVSRNAGSQSELLEARGRVERLSTQVREAETALPRLASAAAELAARIAETSAQFRSDSRTALSDAQVELRRVQEDIKTENDRVRRTVVTAPVAGTVNKLLANTVGGVVRPGETLLELTPSDTALAVETRASPAERGALQVGQAAKVRVAAYDYTQFGTLAARVTEISADSLADERGERYFRVALVVDAASARRFGQSLSPGMTVTADAITGQRTILQYLLTPIRGLAATAFRDRK